MKTMLHALAGLLVLTTSNVASAVDDAAQWLPSTTLVYANVIRTDTICDILFHPELARHVAELDGVKRFLKSPPGARLLEIQAEAGDQIEQVTRGVTARGVHLAIDARTQSAIILVHADDHELPATVMGELCELLESESRRGNRPSPVESRIYRNASVWKLAPQWHAGLLDDVLVFSNKAAGVEAVIDRREDDTLRGLTDMAPFLAARQSAGEGAVAWAMVSLAPLRLLPQVADVLERRSDNPVGEIVLGGLLDGLARTPTITASARTSGTSATLELALSAGSRGANRTRSWHFVAAESAGSPAATQLSGTLATVSLTRDLAGMWMHRERLFDERVNAQLTQADTNLGLYFSGRDFGPEVLARLGDRWQLFVTRRTFANGEPAPSVKLPALAGVVELKDPAFADALLLAYQNIIGIINLQGIQEGRPQLLLSSEAQGTARMMTTRFVLPEGADGEALGIEYNFTPACAVTDTHFVIGSTADVVRDCLARLSSATGAGGEQPAAPNLLVELQAAPLLAQLADNRQLIIGRNMLAEGRSRDEARQYIERLLQLAQRLDAAELRLEVTDKKMSLLFNVAWRNAKP